MVPERKRDWSFEKDREIHGEDNLWIAAQRLKKSCGLGADNVCE